MASLIGPLLGISDRLGRIGGAMRAEACASGPERRARQRAGKSPFGYTAISEPTASTVDAGVAPCMNAQEGP